jgi:hypothetical protein
MVRALFFSTRATEMLGYSGPGLDRQPARTQGNRSNLALSWVLPDLCQCVLAHILGYYSTVLELLAGLNLDLE